MIKILLDMPMFYVAIVILVGIGVAVFREWKRWK